MSDETQKPRSGPQARGHRDLLVWQKEMQLTRHIYSMTVGFPVEERFGLVPQMRRAAVSIPSNIAQGQARHSTGEFVLFISHAEGSLAELDTQLQWGADLQFLAPRRFETAQGDVMELRKMLNALRRKLESNRH